MANMSDLLGALPEFKAQTVSLLDALPDPNARTFVEDYDRKRSLLESNPLSMSAAERFAVLMHKKQVKEDDDGGRRSKKVKTAPALPKKKREKRVRGKEIKARTRGNQRGQAK